MQSVHAIPQNSQPRKWPPAAFLATSDLSWPLIWEEAFTGLTVYMNLSMVNQKLSLLLSLIGTYKGLNVTSSQEEIQRFYLQVEFWKGWFFPLSLIFSHSWVRMIRLFA